MTSSLKIVGSPIACCCPRPCSVCNQTRRLDGQELQSGFFHCWSVSFGKPECQCPGTYNLIIMRSTKHYVCCQAACCKAPKHLLHACVTISGLSLFCVHLTSWLRRSRTSGLQQLSCGTGLRRHIGGQPDDQRALVVGRRSVFPQVILHSVSCCLLFRRLKHGPIGACDRASLCLLASCGELLQ